MSRNTLLALWGAATILGYLVTFSFNISQAGTDASAAVPNPVPATEATAPVNADASGSSRATDEVSTKSDTLSVDTGFPTGENDTLATDTSAVGTVIPASTYPDSVLASTVSPSGPDTSLAERSMPADPDTMLTSDPALQAAADRDAEVDAVTPEGILEETATVDTDVLWLILLMWATVMLVPILIGLIVSATRAREHLALSVVWALLISAALLQNLWAVGATEGVQAFSFYPLWFFVAALGFGITAAKLDLSVQRRLYAAAAGANLVYGIGLLVLPPLSAFAFLVAAALQGIPMVLDPILTARARRSVRA